VYVAGPISSSGEVFDNLHAGVKWGRRMMLDGLAPFVPHFDAWYFLPDGNWNAYLELDLEYVAVADALFRIDGVSKGADLECEIARSLGIPVFAEDEYLDLLQMAHQRALAGKQAHA
jgi:hypothetical protein